MNAPRLDPVFLSFQAALAGRYSIDREIGRGGMGIVYLAREVQLDRLVAIKLLPPEQAYEDERRERFVREARLAARLSHPNIIPIFAVDDIDGFVFFAMAYVSGETLAERVRRRGPLPAGEAARVIREVAWALGHAHAHGVVHRDVKPDNILLENGTGRALVADFGIAGATGADVSEGVMGTPEFMSPEQVLGQTLGPASDLYSLGAMAYFACSGRLPFEGARPTEVLAKHVTESPAPLASLGVAVPRRLAQVVDRCLAKEVGQRPESAEAVAEAVTASIEQRREVPAVLRAFVKRDSRIEGVGVGIGLYMLATGTVGIVSAGAPVIGLGTLLGGIVGLPFAYLTWSARRVLRHGFGPQDIDPAFQSEIAQLREEYEAQHGTKPPVVEKWLGRTAAASALALVAGGSVVLLTQDPALKPILGPILATAGTALVPSYVGYRILRGRRRHVGLERWAKFWRGRIGRAIFAVAAKVKGKGASAPALTHRATELSLGLAAEQLFEGLPKAVRRELGDLPRVLRALQRDAHTLKKRLDLFQQALSDGGARAEGNEYRDIRAARDQTEAKVREVVGALERMRLDLLRLHAGSLSPSGLTTQLGHASDVALEVERLIAAQGEVNEMLRDGRRKT